MRLDVFLTERGLARSRTEARRLIEDGHVSVLGTVRDKPAFPIEETTPDGDVTVWRDAVPFVSRGGEKLRAALDAFSLSPRGLCAMDVGASSGGFTDCLLRYGAARVLAVDSGCGQLAEALRTDERVLSFEHYNARFLKLEDFPEQPRFAVMDVSFISQTLILPALAALLPEGAPYVGLIKPQFEVGRAGVGKGGIVRDEARRREAVDRVITFAEG
ncbi:MAG: TlyA family RNA methyltransferase, partial [Clostridia bacterium]|nr:TlyA family RNA methyltransferase [Clostridia bacterium]